MGRILEDAWGEESIERRGRGAKTVVPLGRLEASLELIVNGLWNAPSGWIATRGP